MKTSENFHLFTTHWAVYANWFLKKVQLKSNDESQRQPKGKKKCSRSVSSICRTKTDYEQACHLKVNNLVKDRHSTWNLWKKLPQSSRRERSMGNGANTCVMSHRNIKKICQWMRNKENVGKSLIYEVHHQERLSWNNRSTSCLPIQYTHTTKIPRKRTLTLNDSLWKDLVRLLKHIFSKTWKCCPRMYTYLGIWLFCLDKVLFKYFFIIISSLFVCRASFNSLFNSLVVRLLHFLLSIRLHARNPSVLW